MFCRHSPGLEAQKRLPDWASSYYCKQTLPLLLPPCFHTSSLPVLRKGETGAQVLQRAVHGGGLQYPDEKATRSAYPQHASPIATAQPNSSSSFLGVNRDPRSKLLTGMAALTSLVEAGSLAACVLCCVQQMHMHAQSVALHQQQYLPVSQEAAGGSRGKKPEQLQAALADRTVPSPEWTWQWQQLGSLQASLLTCALLARFVASLLWKVVRHNGAKQSNATSATASLELSARVLRMEAMLAKQQQSLDNATRQADKAALAGRLHRHDIKQPTAQMQATLARHTELLLKLASAQEKLEKQVQDTQLLLGAMQNVSGRQFEVSVQAIQQLKAQQAQLQESLREVRAAAAEASKWASSGAAAAIQDNTQSLPSSAGGLLSSGRKNLGDQGRRYKGGLPGGSNQGNNNQGSSSQGGSLSGSSRGSQGSSGSVGSPCRSSLDPDEGSSSSLGAHSSPSSNGGSLSVSIQGSSNQGSSSKRGSLGGSNQDSNSQGSSSYGASLSGGSQGSHNQGSSSSLGALSSSSPSEGGSLSDSSACNSSQGSSSSLGSPASSDTSSNGGGSSDVAIGSGSSNVVSGMSSSVSSSSSLRSRGSRLSGGQQLSSIPSSDPLTSSSPSSSPGSGIEGPGTGSSSSSSSSSSSDTKLSSTPKSDSLTRNNGSSSSSSSPGNQIEGLGNGSSSSSSSSSGSSGSNSSIDDSGSSSGKHHGGSPRSGTISAWQASDPWAKPPPVVAHGGSS
ncbi:hypothetical protein DUNSADRAFT_13211 [Dunaliella salina]|uniref:Uncharacterized protein n=1 Tax=Dunaliella salina TaxID=3046 RepID=A0ABQ7G9T5_DUNSA|nr:hypothetical protein DUNSADRAFT_13211 [Dunaliella salina]|eukprot:KAF5831369.1 hypothetical protein DUNSADRAFT_13211 [Dunaliella salina]